MPSADERRASAQEDLVGRGCLLRRLVARPDPGKTHSGRATDEKRMLEFLR